jgi:hypothetical protein
MKLSRIILLIILIIVSLSISCDSQVDTFDAEVRSIDGTGNNLNHSIWGSAGSQLRRVTSVDYSDGISGPAGINRPNPRVISNTLSAQTFSVLDELGLSDFVWAWGQFITHDVVLTKEQDQGEKFDILVPTGDPWFDPEGNGDIRLSLTRTVYDNLTGTDSYNPRQQLSMITSWVDASMVYGSDSERAAWLRTNIGGRLKVIPYSPGDLLPFNDGTQPNAGGPSTDLFVAGDVRVNVSTNLIVLHTLFVREHNRLADEIAGEHPDWSDEQIYQKARRIVSAEIQAITYNEFLPALLGDDALDDYRGYDPDVDPSGTNAFAGAVFRIGHSQIGSQFLLLDTNGNEIPEGHLAMEDAFFNPSVIIGQGIEPVLRGLAANTQEATDLLIIDAIRNAFTPPNANVNDVISLDIQRGREQGLPSYNRMRQDFGLDPITGFDGITSDVNIQAALEAVYGTVDDIDPLIGMLAEDHLPGASVGELTFTIIKEQFEAVRDGDRFWYTIDPGLTSGEISRLGRTRLSIVILRNTVIDDIQRNVFFVP